MTQFSIRGIEKRDAEALLRLRNLDSDLKYFQTPEPVSALDHNAWVEERIKSCSDFTLVLEANNVVLGVAYVNSLKDAEIAIRLDPLVRNQGHAVILLKALENALAILNVPRLIAVIHKLNHRSLEFFESAKYIALENEGQSSFIRLSKELTIHKCL